MPNKSYPFHRLLSIVGVSLLLLTLTFAGLARSQTTTAVLSIFRHPATAPTGFGGGEADFLPTDHLTAAQTNAIQAEIEHNIAQLTADNIITADTAANATAVSLAWPLSAANGLTDPGYHSVSGFVDQDPRYPDFLRDHYCGRRTYDTYSGYNHQGTDYFTWPFPWNRMDNNEVIVIAAAPGLIINKKDGNFDHNCDISGGTWNAVYIQHSDGSIAWYGHLKNGSLTNKAIGDSVAVGDYLGVVGSSGNSTGPHLHLELHDKDYNLIDPYQGSCNQLNNDSWWAAQRPYYDSAVNKIMTGAAPVSFSQCPAPDVPHEQDTFTPGDEIFFTTFYRDQRAIQTSEYTIYRPDNSVFQSWSHNSSASHYPASWWWWSFDLPADAPGGTWRFVVTFNGVTYETAFTVIVPRYVTVSAPTASAFWLPGSTYTITWQDNLTAAIGIDLRHLGTLSETIIATTANNGFYTWTVPVSTAVALGYQIRVTDLNNPANFGDSAHFAIGRRDQFLFSYLPVVHKE